MSDPVYAILSENDMLKMIVRTKVLAERYCILHPEYYWEAFAIQESEEYF